MRRSLTLLLLLAATLGLAGLELLPSTGAATLAVVPVNVRIGCDGENVGEFFISSQTAVLHRSEGDTARFQLLGGSDVETVQVQPKPDVEWPFVDAPPVFGRGNDAGTGAIRTDVADAVYGYNLVVTCGVDPDTIDPNMDIKP